jgi:hypothetical protein
MAYEVMTYNEMCLEVGFFPPMGMVFHPEGLENSFLFVSLMHQPDYDSESRQGGRGFAFVGHDAPISKKGFHASTIDQELYTVRETLTENGKFHFAALAYKQGKRKPEPVEVYEKLQEGIWTYKGSFLLTDTWMAKQNNRRIFKFELTVPEEDVQTVKRRGRPSKDPVYILAQTKYRLWRTFRGRCTVCQSNENLRFVFVTPPEKGGLINDIENVMLVCQEH